MPVLKHGIQRHQIFGVHNLDLTAAACRLMKSDRITIGQSAYHILSAYFGGQGRLSSNEAGTDDNRVLNILLLDINRACSRRDYFLNGLAGRSWWLAQQQRLGRGGYPRDSHQEWIYVGLGSVWRERVVFWSCTALSPAETSSQQSPLALSSTAL
ncbi:hypothetical protein E1B28_011743 [Marasmius oreades]|uniref:Uncharacterized protein n=1 Tax=Marasmius oreades TaxID=181124 RepID=A0A9P7RUX1_9AGAR|nr:uncharacterized protein E1B28_011743 [Marasmius oreades]KAG7090135.1 hypothetical protein E1B28_011743 [Marasmius oreades]